MTSPEGVDRPRGRRAVIHALVESAVALIIEEGLQVSVRRIAARAGVNHGLVHTYFGSKDDLLRVAMDTVVRRASADGDADGFPPADVAGRRDAELARVLARVRTDRDRSLLTSHPIIDGWRVALARSDADRTSGQVDEMIALASALGLGWAFYGDHIRALLELDDDATDRIAARVNALVAELGGIPTNGGGSPSVPGT